MTGKFWGDKKSALCERCKQRPAGTEAHPLLSPASYFRGRVEEWCPHCQECQVDFEQQIIADGRDDEVDEEGFAL